MAPTWDFSKSGSSESRAQGSRSSKSEVEKQESSEQDSREAEESTDDESTDSPEESSESCDNEPKTIQPETFIIRVENLKPQFGPQGPNHDKRGSWDPPETTSELQKSDLSDFRWKDGSIEVVGLTDPIYGQGFDTWTPHGVASVFPQIGQGHLLVVDVDAAQRKVSESGCGCWKALTFRHEKKGSSGSLYYSYLDFAADHEHTAAHIENNCVPQLLPPIYNLPASERKHAGLIGKLPLLIAIAALSCPKDNRNPIMTRCIQPGKWVEHKEVCGRDKKWHGVVVSVFYDGANPNGSNLNTLKRIENGVPGPFYGP